MSQKRKHTGCQKEPSKDLGASGGKPKTHWSQQQADKPGPLGIQRWFWLEWVREVVWEVLGSLGDRVRMRAAAVKANCFGFLLCKDHRQRSNGAEPAPS